MSRYRVTCSHDITNDREPYSLVIQAMSMEEAERRVEGMPCDHPHTIEEVP